MSEKTFAMIGRIAVALLIAIAAAGLVVLGQVAVFSAAVELHCWFSTCP